MTEQKQQPNRTSKIEVRVTAAEKSAIQSLAVQAGQSISDLIRNRFSELFSPRKGADQ